MLKEKNTDTNCLKLGTSTISFTALDDTMAVVENSLRLAANSYFFYPSTPSLNFESICLRTNERHNSFQYLYSPNVFIQSDKRFLGKIAFNQRATVVEDRSKMQTFRKDVSGTWVDNIEIPFQIDKLIQGVKPIADRLFKFAMLEENWDSYGGQPISRETIFEAMDFFMKVLDNALKNNKNNVPVPFVAPLSDGGINFHWKTCFRELLHIIPNGKGEKIDYLKIDKQTNEEEEGEFSNLGSVVQLVEEWLL